MVLLFTSCLFIVPVFISMKKRRRNESLSVSILTCTSLWYHGTQNSIAYFIDKTYAHIFSIYYISKACLNCIFKRRTTDIVTCIFSISSALLHYTENTRKIQDNTKARVLVHSGLHITGTIALSIYFASLQTFDSSIFSSAFTLELVVSFKLLISLIVVVDFFSI